MTNLENLTVEQLRKIVAIKEEIEQLEAELNSITGAAASGMIEARAGGPKRRRGRMSAAARAAIGAAQRRRWAKFKGRGRKAATEEKGTKAKRKVSVATRARLAAAAKTRWARAKAAGQSGL